VVIAATGYGQGLNANIDVALGGIIVCGAVCRDRPRGDGDGAGWIERLMPPVVTGSVVAVIGLNLASLPIKTMAPTAFDACCRP
jgi:xanthine/uracil permease